MRPEYPDGLVAAVDGDDDFCANVTVHIQAVGIRGPLQREGSCHLDGELALVDKGGKLLEVFAHRVDPHSRHDVLDNGFHRAGKLATQDCFRRLGEAAEESSAQSLDKMERLPLNT